MSKEKQKCDICAREVDEESREYTSLSVHRNSPVNHSFSGFTCPKCAKKFTELMDWINEEGSGR